MQTDWRPSSDKTSLSTADRDAGLRGYLNDVAALSTLHAIWLGQPIDAVAGMFADALLRTLQGDVVYVRLPAPISQDGLIEAARTRLGARDVQSTADLGRWFSRLSASSDLRLPSSGPLGEVPINLAVASVGHISGESGMVVVGAHRDGFPSEYDHLLLRIGANQLALTLRSAEAQAARSELAAVSERQRLARELHDSVSQTLYAIGMGTQTALDLLPRDFLAVREPLEHVQTLVRGSLAEMRAIIFDLRPESLAKEGLAVALARQVNVLRTRYGIDVDVRLEQEPATSMDVKQALYRIAQEALHNIVKHSNAHTVQLHLVVEAELITLLVADDGMGFDPGEDFPGHLGLQSMRERALQVGAEFEITSIRGRGSAVKVRVPIPTSS